MTHTTAIVVATLVVVAPQSYGRPAQALEYEINLNDRTDDLFRVTLRVNGLPDSSAIYQFAATAPGTYQVMDIGRYVRSFVALGAKNDTLPVHRISMNQWRIGRPASVRMVVYTIAETWDTPMDSNRIYAMCGTSMEDDHVLLNPHCVIGYPTGMQQSPIHLRLLRPPAWAVGTALEPDDAGGFVAPDYDRLVDSPILLGRLSCAGLTIGGSSVEVFTYSKTDKVHSDDILGALRGILYASAAFMHGLPVQRYTFLFHCDRVNAGAWEHSYSSEYVYRESDFDRNLPGMISSNVAHEFFHIVTPLHIHSQVIDRFNFVTPVPSKHLWLYEGVTEWAADIVRLRGGLISLPDYLSHIRRKLLVNDRMDKQVSLEEIALSCYTPEGQRQYANIYDRGAVIAALLDIRLLSLSGGTWGLREVINELAARYGPHKAFDEATFYDSVVSMTHPSIGSFINSYIRGAEPLPVAEVFSLVGISYREEVEGAGEVSTTGFRARPHGESFEIVSVEEKAAAFGLQKGDTVVAINGTELTPATAGALYGTLRAEAPGSSYTVTVRRAGERERTLTCALLGTPEVTRHVLEVMPDPTPEQRRLRAAWMTNLN